MCRELLRRVANHECNESDYVLSKEDVDSANRMAGVDLNTKGCVTPLLRGRRARGERRGLQRSIELEIVRQETPFGKFFERVNTEYSSLVQDAPVLTAAGKRVLETEGRGEAPNPFDSFKKVSAVVT